LCFGWVDSRDSKLDDERTMLYFAPRKPCSAWAKSNKERVARLIGQGLMMPTGLAKVEAAKLDGTWGVLDGVEHPPGAARPGEGAGGVPARRGALPRLPALGAAKHPRMDRLGEEAGDPCQARLRDRPPRRG